MVEIDVAVFTFDGDQLLRLVNRAGERCSRKPAEQLLGRSAAELGLARLPRRRHAAHRGCLVPRRDRPLGDAPHDVPAGRPAPPAARARRRQPAAARRRAAGVAAADPRHRPRDQQLARADQVDRGQPRVDAGTNCRQRQPVGRPAGRHEARPRRDRGALRFPQPVHDGLCAAGEAARAAGRNRAHPRVRRARGRR